MPVLSLEWSGWGGTLKHPILISACLLGLPCRYDGDNKIIPQMVKLLNYNQIIIPFCPECLGGLGIPRLPAEIVGGDGLMVLNGEARVATKNGQDYTEQFIKGATVVLQIVNSLDAKRVILKSNSPSCGLGEIYDGSFTGVLRHGYGVTAALLKQNPIQLYTEIEFLKKMPQILEEKYY